MLYQACACATGWIPSSEVILNNVGGAYYGESSGAASISPVTDGGITCYKREYIHCPTNLSQYNGNTLSNPSLITIALLNETGFTPMTAMSFNVPAADILPMSPPGKNNG